MLAFGALFCGALIVLSRHDPPARFLLSEPAAALEKRDPAAAVQGRGPSPPALDLRTDAPARGQREPGEWQGMLVFETEFAPCARPDACGLARACVAGRCVGCLTDGDCATTEKCVLDHCIPSANLGCRRKSDCPGDEFCVLSGYTASPRGNEQTVSECIPTTGTRRPVPPYTPARTEEEFSRAPHPRIDHDETIRTLREELRAEGQRSK